MTNTNPCCITKLPIISFIVAAAENQVMGKNNQLPWHLPDDFAFFRRNTLHKPMIMGKNTWLSINRLLPNRPNIILSRSMVQCPDGAYLFNDLNSAIAAFSHEPEIMIIGGAEIFKQAKNQLSRLYLTRVHANIEGDIFLPEIDLSQFQLSFEEHHQTDAHHAYAFTFQIWDKI